MARLIKMDCSLKMDIGWMLKNVVSIEEESRISIFKAGTTTSKTIVSQNSAVIRSAGAF